MSEPSETSDELIDSAGIVFANEFFDALPVEIVSSKGSLRIDTHEEQFVEKWVPSSPEELEFLDRSRPWSHRWLRGSRLEHAGHGAVGGSRRYRGAAQEGEA